MTHEDLIRGSQAILDFLLETKMSIMDDTLSEIIGKGNISLMSDFTRQANKEYQIMPEPLWKESPKEFFSTDKSIKFFNSILRDKKINQILS